MENTVSDILDMFKDFHLLAGANGLGRRVKSVMVVDALPAGKWLKGGELVLTSGYIFKDNPELLGELIQELKSKGAAAVAIKTLHYVNEVPDDVIQTANTLKLPIISIPKETRWVEIISPVLERIISQREGSKYRSQLTLDLINNQISTLYELSERANVFGLNFTRGIIALSIEIDSITKYFQKVKSDVYQSAGKAMLTSVFATASKIIMEAMTNALGIKMSDRVVFVVSPIDGDYSAFLQKLYETAEKLRKNIADTTKVTITIGIGNIKRNPLEAQSSYMEAIQTCELGRMLFSGNKTIMLQDMGIYRLLFRLKGTSEASAFIQQNLGGILKYDKEHNQDMMRVLTCIVENDWNLRQSADQLFMHYNTIKQKFRKIQEILELNDLSSDEKLCIQISLKLVETMSQEELDNLITN